MASISDNPLRVLIAMGTRPEIIKLAPVVWECRRRQGWVTTVLHTGQHQDLAEPMIEYLNVAPDHRFELMADQPSLVRLTSRCLDRAESLLRESRPDCVVVQGDTATCASMSLASFYMRIPVVHIEAGLRTGDIHSPWPEEFNRRIAGLAADLHCAATIRSRDNLLREGIAKEKIVLSGNTIVDALQWTRDKIRNQSNSVRTGLPTIVVTAHRRENFGEPLESICRALLRLAERYSNFRFVFVTHPNPNAGPVVRSILSGHPRIDVVGALDYPTFVELLASATLIISDSGGIQEEAPSLGVPLLITRESTERPEAVESGAALLVGANEHRIVQTASELLDDSKRYQSMQVRENPFGDGNARVKIADAIEQRYGRARIVHEELIRS